jgi:hypothetical protein
MGLSPSEQLLRWPDLADPSPAINSQGGAVYLAA